MMLENTLKQVGLHSQKISRDKFVQLFEIVQQHVTEKITTIKATTQQLLALIDEEGSNYHNKVILCFKTLIEQLPNDSFEAKELELTTRLIQPLLQSLFEDRLENVYLCWTDTQTEEFKKDETNCSNKRPDGCITLKAHELINLGFIKVKEEKYKNNDAKLNKDLHKLGVFCKNPIDQSKLIGVLAASITFCYTKQQSKGFYTMTEIGHLNAPTNLTELLQLVGYVDNLCDLLHVFKINCRQ